VELKHTVCLLSLGCAKNLVDSEVMLGALHRAGFTLTPERGAADIIIVNTCAFLEASTREALAVIFDAARYKQSGRCRHLVVCGCLPQRYKGELARELPEVDLFLGTGEFDTIARHLEKLVAGRSQPKVRTSRPTLLMGAATPRVLSTPAGSAYVKVAEGCSHRCTYCTIPLIRGPYRRRSAGSIITEARNLADRGVKEINLIAQDSTRYDGLPRLLEKLGRIQGLRWIRLLYGHPASITPELVRAMAAEEKVCHYLDLPLQHIADPVLRRMGRKVTRKKIEALIGLLRAAMPDLALRTTFIVGFPGETAKDFGELRSFVREARFDHLGVFCYSPEEGTPAARLPGRVPEARAQERRHELMSLQRAISAAALKSRVGRELVVLAEGPAASKRYATQARSQYQAPEVDGVVLLKEAVPAGTMLSVTVRRALTYDLVAERARP
jgi:ribosomal protein S12 methylthiotransferase